MADFDEIFGDLKDDEYSLAVPTTDIDEVQPPSHKIGSSTKDAQQVKLNSAWAGLGSNEQDDFMAWLDEGESPMTKFHSEIENDVSTSDSNSRHSTISEGISPLDVANEKRLSAPNGISQPDSNPGHHRSLTAGSIFVKPNISIENSTLDNVLISKGPDLVALRKSYIDTGSLLSTTRMALWRHALEIKEQEPFSMYMLQTTKLDLENQEALRKDVEDVCAQIFTSELHTGTPNSSLRKNVLDSTRLEYIDHVELLITFVCKSLNIKYPPLLAFTFAPAILIAGSNPLDDIVVTLLLAVSDRILRHIKVDISLKKIADVRRPCLKWLLLYHAPRLAIHLDQYFHTWDSSSSSVLMDTWVASMFESDTHQSIDFLVTIWDYIILSPSPLQSQTFHPIVGSFIIVAALMESENRLISMQSMQLQHCMGQTLSNVIKSTNLLPRIVSLMKITPPSFIMKVSCAGFSDPKQDPPQVIEGPQRQRANSGKFNLITASTNGVRELSHIVVDMPVRLFDMVPGLHRGDATQTTLSRESLLFDQHYSNSNTNQSMALTIPAADVIGPIFLRFTCQDNSTADQLESIRYFVVDCRAAEESRVGQIPTSFHFDPEAVTDPSVLENVLKTLEPLKGDFHLCVVGCGYGYLARQAQEHLQSRGQLNSMSSASTRSNAPISPYAQLGSKFHEQYARDLTRVNAAVLFLLKRGFPRVSVLEGGFAGAHEYLLCSPMMSLDDLIDHYAPTCPLCMHSESLKLGLRFESHSESSPMQDESFVQLQERDQQQKPPTHRRSSSANSLSGVSNEFSGGYLSSVTDACKTGGMALLHPTTTIRDGTKWFVQKRKDESAITEGTSPSLRNSGFVKNTPPAVPMTVDKKEQLQAPVIQPLNDTTNLDGSRPKTSMEKMRASVTNLGAETFEVMKKSQKITAKATQKLPFGGSVFTSSSYFSSPLTRSKQADQSVAQGSPIPYPTTSAANTDLPGAPKLDPEKKPLHVNPPPLQQPLKVKLPPRPAVKDIFVIDDEDDEDDEQSNDSRFVSNPTTGSSNLASPLIEFYQVNKDNLCELKKNMAVNRPQLQPLMRSPFYAIQKKKMSKELNSVDFVLVPRRLVIVSGYILVLKAIADLDEAYKVKSCRSVTQIAKMTCLKKDALMVTMYFHVPGLTPTDPPVDKKKTYEIQQRDEFIKMLRAVIGQTQ